MIDYDIERWDVVMFGTSVTKVPMIYIKPDTAFLDFVRVNNFAVMCNISGTGTEYDGKNIAGVVDKSCTVPNCRPNFCAATGYYVITLYANWYGYPTPDKMGKVKIMGLKEPEKSSASVASTAGSGDSKNNGDINKGAVAGLFILLFLIGLFIVRVVKS